MWCANLPRADGDVARAQYGIFTLDGDDKIASGHFRRDGL